MSNFNEMIGQGLIVNVITGNGREYKDLVFVEEYYPSVKPILIFNEPNGGTIRINPSYIESIEDSNKQENWYYIFIKLLKLINNNSLFYKYEIKCLTFNL